MPNILTIITSLFLLIACSEEKDTAEIPPPLQQAAPEAIREHTMEHTQNPEMNISEIEASTEDSNKEWDIIVEPNGNGASHSKLQNNNIDNTINSPSAKENLARLGENLDRNEASGISKESSTNTISGPEISDKPTFQVNKNDIVLGNACAKVVCIEYYSPTCPHCAYYNKVILPQLKKKYIDTNQIAYVIREFIGNKQDLDAAILQRCPNTLDGFLKLQKVILEDQDKWAYSKKYRELLIDIGENGGLSKESYAKCLKDDNIIKMLIANTHLANRSPNFMGTPAFFINGVLITDGYDFNNLVTKLDKALGFTQNSK